MGRENEGGELNANVKVRYLVINQSIQPVKLWRSMKNKGITEVIIQFIPKEETKLPKLNGNRWKSHQSHGIYFLGNKKEIL